MTVVVPRREKVALGDPVDAEAGVEVLGADQLLVAVGGIEVLARRALAVPTGDLLIAELPADAARVGTRAVAEAGMLGPDARVDDADDDVLAGAALAAFSTEITPSVFSRAAAWASVSFAAKPLRLYL